MKKDSYFKLLFPYLEVFLCLKVTIRDEKYAKYIFRSYYRELIQEMPPNGLY